MEGWSSPTWWYSHRIHVWYVYLHLPFKQKQPNVGKYTILTWKYNQPNVGKYTNNPIGSYNGNQPFFFCRASFQDLEKTRWWLQIFFIFTPTWGNDPIWLIFFKGVETTNQKSGFVGSQTCNKSGLISRVPLAIAVLPRLGKSARLGVMRWGFDLWLSWKFTGNPVSPMLGEPVDFPWLVVRCCNKWCFSLRLT